jgi:hypothetical protein
MAEAPTADELREDARNLVADPTMHQGLGIELVAQTLLAADCSLENLRQRQISLVVHLDGELHPLLDDANAVTNLNPERLAFVAKRIVAAGNAVGRFFNPTNVLFTTVEVMPRRWGEEATGGSFRRASARG